MAQYNIVGLTLVILALAGAVMAEGPASAPSPKSASPHDSNPSPSTPTPSNSASPPSPTTLAPTTTNSASPPLPRKVGPPSENPKTKSPGPSHLDESNSESDDSDLESDDSHSKGSSVLSPTKTPAESPEDDGTVADETRANNKNSAAALEFSAITITVASLTATFLF